MTEISTKDITNTQSTQLNETADSQTKKLNLMVISGHIHQIREWCERLDDAHIYETMGTIVAICEPCFNSSSASYERTFVIRDNIRMGPTFKVTYPITARPLTFVIKVGLVIRVVGKLLFDRDTIMASKISCPSKLEVEIFDRITYVCGKHIMKHLLSLQENHHY